MRDNMTTSRRRRWGYIDAQGDLGPPAILRELKQKNDEKTEVQRGMELLDSIPPRRPPPRPPFNFWLFLAIVALMADLLNLAFGLWPTPWMCIKMISSLYVAVDLSKHRRSFDQIILTLGTFALISALYATKFVANPFIFAPALGFLVGKSIIQVLPKRHYNYMNNVLNDLNKVVSALFSNFRTRKSCFQSFKCIQMAEDEQCASFRDGFNASKMWTPYLKSCLQPSCWKNAEAFKAGMHVGHTVSHVPAEACPEEIRVMRRYQTN